MNYGLCDPPVADGINMPPVTEGFFTLRTEMPEAGKGEAGRRGIGGGKRMKMTPAYSFSLVS